MLLLIYFLSDFTCLYILATFSLYEFILWRCILVFLHQVCNTRTDLKSADFAIRRLFMIQSGTNNKYCRRRKFSVFNWQMLVWFGFYLLYFVVYCVHVMLPFAVR